MEHIVEFLRAAVHGVEVADAVVYVALTLPQTAVDGAELLGNRKPCRVVGGGVHAVPGAEPP